MFILSRLRQRVLRGERREHCYSRRDEETCVRDVHAVRRWIDGEGVRAVVQGDRIERGERAFAGALDYAQNAGATCYVNSMKCRIVGH